LPPGDETMITLRCDAQTKLALAAIAKRDRRDLTGVVLKALDEYVRRWIRTHGWRTLEDIVREFRAELAAGPAKRKPWYQKR
jgi:hypothetical protein